MPELHSGSQDVAPARQLNGTARVDPLDALRAADHRPTTTIWREHLRERMQASSGLPVRRGLRVAGSVAASFVTIAIVWQLFVVTEPPVEDSIPFVAAPTATAATEVSVVSSTAAIDATASGADGSAAAQRQQVVVHVAGAVAEPGLVTGFDGWRIDDAVRAAGGALPTADHDRLNLAALITDGERIYVPAEGEDEPAVLSSSGGVGGQVSTSPTVVNLNTASAVELQTLPGIGPATAEVIVSHREEHGSFGDVDALVAVRGIGPATLEALRDHIRVG